MKKVLVILLLVALFVSGCGNEKQTDAAPAGTAAPTEDPAPATEEVETPAPERGGSEVVFATTDREGNTWDESVFADAELTMINFWEPWCGPCVGEMPDLQKLQDNYADHGFQILGVYSTEGMEEDVDAVLARTGVTYPILHYTGAFDRFQSGYVPTTVFIDREGSVLAGADGELYIGSNSYEGWAEIIEGLL